MPISISLDPADRDIDAIHRILAGTYWSSCIRREVVDEAFRNSIAVVAIDAATGQTVGGAGLVTDCATSAWRCDVIVIETHRGRGIAHRMIEELECQPSLQTVRRWALATRDAQKLYEDFGSQKVAHGSTWMEKPRERMLANRYGLIAIAVLGEDDGHSLSADSRLRRQGPG